MMSFNHHERSEDGTSSDGGLKMLVITKIHGRSKGAAWVTFGGVLVKGMLKYASPIAMNH